MSTQSTSCVGSGSATMIEQRRAAVRGSSSLCTIARRCPAVSPSGFAAMLFTHAAMDSSVAGDPFAALHSCLWVVFQCTAWHSRQHHHATWARIHTGVSYPLEERECVVAWQGTSRCRPQGTNSAADAVKTCCTASSWKTINAAHPPMCTWSWTASCLTASCPAAPMRTQHSPLQGIPCSCCR